MKWLAVCVALAACYHDPPPPQTPVENHTEPPPSPPPPPRPLRPAESPLVQSVIDSGLPTECVDYARAIEKLANCDKLPQASKDALRTSAQTMSDSWKEFGTMPDEAKRAAADACKQAADAVNQTADVCK